MKKKSLKYLVLGCIAAALAGAMTACGGSRTPNSSSSDTGSSPIQTGTDTGGSDTGSSGNEVEIISSDGVFMSLEVENAKTHFICEWESVENAVKYTLKIGEQCFETVETEYDVTSVLALEEIYVIEITAQLENGEAEPLILAGIAREATKEIEYTEISDGYSVKKKENAEIWGALILPDTYNGQPIVEIEDFGFKETYSASETGLKRISSVRFPKQLKKIGTSALASCIELRSAILPESLEELGGGVFFRCVSLQSVTIPKNLKKIPSSTFAYCSQLTEIQLPEGLETIEPSAFCNTALKEITIPNSVKEMRGSAFWGCKDLTEAVLPGDLKIITEETFYGCEKLARIVLPSGLEEIEKWAFQGCKSLTEINLPESLQTIGEFAFDESGIERIFIPATLTGSIVGSFVGKNFKEITIDENNPIYKTVDGNIYSKDGTVLVQYLTGKTATSFVVPQGVLKIEAYAFCECLALENIIFPDGLEELGAYAFQGCTGITEVVLPESLRIYRAAFNRIPMDKMVILAGIEDYDFFEHQVKVVEFSEGMTVIKVGTFFLYNVSIIVPKSAEVISGKAWMAKILAVYYLGTKEEYKEITSNSTTGTPVYFYSEKEPEEEGNFWHYDQNGMPVVWE